LHVGAFGSVIGFLGVGKVPLTILLMSYCFVWGAVGLSAITLWGTAAVGKAVAVALIAAVLVTRFVAAGIARVLPSVESYHTPLRQLVGLSGEVLYEVTNDSGTVRLRDPSSDLRDVSSRIPAGAPRLPAGTRVMLLRYDAAARTFLVTPSQGEPK
jgi:membrane protein implicated in regulation of membrane protease activity